MSDAIRLESLLCEEIPPAFRLETYFDFESNPFWHEGLFGLPEVCDVVSAVQAIGPYVGKWLRGQLPELEAQRPCQVLDDAELFGFDSSGRYRVIMENGARFMPSSVFGAMGGASCHTIHVGAGAVVAGDIHATGGCVYIGKGSRVERGASIHGPAIIGDDNEIRMGAYLRGNVITGHGCCIRGELKNVVLMDSAMFPHACYVGDSLCGFRSHFGNQATTANYGLFEGARPAAAQRTICVTVEGATYDLGVVKFGAVVGDFCQIGCGAVTDPGTFLAPHTMVYPLTRVKRGVYGPQIVIKNKPAEHGVIEMSPLEFLG